MNKISIIVVFAIFFSCNQSAKYESSSENATASSMALYSAYSEMGESPVSSSAAKEDHKNPSRKFVRKANLKFRSKNVVQSTYDVEKIVSDQGGFVTLTELKTNVEDITKTIVSTDSILERTQYYVTNTMTIRVPNVQLDTTLKLIARNIEVLDYRTISADDVSLHMMSNNMAGYRLDESEKRLKDAIAHRGKKLEETMNAEELLSQKQEQADNAHIQNRSLSDQVNFSTIQIEMYQRSEVRHEFVQNMQNIRQYEPNLFRKIWESIMDGWQIVEWILVGIFKLWAIIAIGGMIFMGVKMMKKKWK